jgi:hypothetical protein
MPWHHLACLIVVLAAPSYVGAQVNFVANAPSSTTEVYEFAAISKHSMKSKVLSVEGASTASTRYRFDFGPHHQDGYTPVNISVASLKLEADSPVPPEGKMVKLIFDSAKPNAKATNPLFEPVLAQQRKLLQSKQSYEYGDDHKIYRPQGETGELTPEQSQLLGFMNWRMGTMLQQGVQVGDTWVVQEQRVLGLGQVVELEKHFEYLGIDKSDASIKSKKKLHKFGIATKNPKITFTNFPGGNLEAKEVTIEGEAGEMLFNEVQGRMESAAESFKIFGRLVVNAGGVDVVADVTVSVESTTKFIE